MKEFRVFYVVMLTISCLLCFVYQSRLTLILFAALIICPSLSFFILIINYFSLKISISPDKLVLEKYKDYNIFIILKNRSIFPVSIAKISGFFQKNADLSEMLSDGAFFVNVPPFAEMNFDLRISLPYRGEYLIGPEILEVYDFFSLFRLKKNIYNKCAVLVLPREIEIDVPEIKNDSADNPKSESVVSFFNSFDTDFSSVREYREGDTLRRIHWKLSAKQDNLIVKESEQLCGKNCVILCDFSSVSGFENNENKEFILKTSDAVIECALALARKAISAGIETDIFWRDTKSGKISGAKLTDFKNYKEFLNAMALLPGKTAPGDFYELLKLSNENLNSGKFIYIITPDFTEEMANIFDDSGNACLVTFDFNKTKNIISYLYKVLTNKICNDRILL